MHDLDAQDNIIGSPQCMNVQQNVQMTRANRVKFSNGVDANMVCISVADSVAV